MRRHRIFAIAIAAAVCCLAVLGAGCHQEPRPAAGGRLWGKRIAILSQDGFEKAELIEPRRALAEAGATTVVVSPLAGSVRAWDTDHWDGCVKVNAALAGARPEDFDGLLLPGGVMNPDRLRMDPAAVAFVHGFVAAGKPIAAICHGPWTLIEADGVRGKRMTSWPSLRTDLRNAGADWVDEPVVTDANLVTSRKPADLPAFDQAIIELFAAATPRATARPEAP